MQIANIDLVKVQEGTEITVDIITPQLGWNVDLSMVQYVKVPDDKIQEIHVIGVPPGIIGLPAIEMHRQSALLGDDFIGARLIYDPNQLPVVIREVTKKQEPIGKDMIWSARVIGIRQSDKLMMDVTYGGGHYAHGFQLDWDGDQLESFPVQLNLKLSHNAFGDSAKAIINQQLMFDLSTVGLPPEGILNLCPPNGAAVQIPYKLKEV